MEQRKKNRRLIDRICEYNFPNSEQTLDIPALSYCKDSLKAWPFIKFMCGLCPTSAMSRASCMVASYHMTKPQNVSVGAKLAINTEKW